MKAIVSFFYSILLLNLSLYKVSLFLNDISLPMKKIADSRTKLSMIFPEKLLILPNRKSSIKYSCILNKTNDLI